MRVMTSGRRERRQAAEGSVGLRQPGERKYPASIFDVSTKGCRIELTKTMPVDSRVWVELPGLESLSGTVRWTDGWVAGVEFARPLHPAVLELIVSRISPDK